MTKKITTLLLSSFLVACGGGDGDSVTTIDVDTGVGIYIHTYNFVFQGAYDSDVIVDATYESYQSGTKTTVLHSNAIYGSSDANVLEKAIKDGSEEIDVNFELRDANTNVLLADKQESYEYDYDDNDDDDYLDKLVFAVADETLSPVEYKLEVFDRPKEQSTATSAPLYVINLLGNNDVNVIIDNVQFQGELETIELSDKYDVDLTSPLSNITLQQLDGTELVSCDLSSESFAEKQSLIIFSKSTSGNASCLITEV